MRRIEGNAFERAKDVRDNADDMYHRRAGMTPDFYVDLKGELGWTGPGVQTALAEEKHEGKVVVGYGA